MRPPVIRVVLLVAGIEVSGLETEGALAEVVDLLARAEFLSEDFLKHLTVPVAGVTIRVQWASP